MILLIDNYDSFTYNLYQSLATSGAQVEVVRNDAISVAEVLAKQANGIVLSPGPGRPEGAGICLELLKSLPDTMPLLGVCLGHQAMVEHFGGDLEVDPVPTHGKASMVHYKDGCDLYKGLPNPFPAGRYHSLRAVRGQLPAQLKLTAWTEEGLVMGVQHEKRPWFGMQFHPESILTPQGDRMLQKFLQEAGEGCTS
ncbi:MAG: aminodeoxychorismate/anthranilate synthase component II [Planctomycetes bacterium]|nr:aminodeoxychorismate/anthranilate synthase component II [Planctomycetota bacterium]MCP4771201.1 aminodeoxychorismate/anthranilate synthase component II [Planctomycetota bacterium]MCP4862072.1 aminodeoxychorismate/anthranilate synthase component II [Planctomycetota bacterium]